MRVIVVVWSLAFVFVLFDPAARADTKTKLRSIGSNSNFSCLEPAGYCKRMKSCARACFYLVECGKTRLDRDNDGIPCENVCRRRCARKQ